ncbi:MAG: HEAT repeat domain-containing protein [Tatlockia sp.]|nr:HEAT repeat domain-containing protein [Tatlockia sp.]
MRKLRFLILGLVVLTGKLNAGTNNFDIFGVDAKTQNKIHLSCSKLMDKYLKLSMSMNTSLPSEKALIHREKIEQQIIAKIKQIEDVDIAKISVIYYPTDKRTYATLDLVKRNEAYRIPRGHKTVSKKLVKQSQGLKELFVIWNEYNDKNVNLIRKNQMDFSKKSCPITHCTWAFDKKELEKTLPKLQNGAAKFKNELIEIIKNSSDDKEREKAVFILAHDETHKDEQAGFLINYTDDPSDFVRNNVMRVVGAMVAKRKVAHLDIKRIIHALNYPYVTDRNKAAYVLLGIVKNDPLSHQAVIAQAGGTLLELLKLQQPNNHDFAYLILKEISQRNYSERDYKSWEGWIRSQQSVLSST